MAKIEEITALLMDEIKIFEQNISKLKEESNKIHNTKLIIDSSKIENIFSQFLKQLNHDIEKLRIQTDGKTKSNYVPNWIGLLFLVCLSIIMISISINYLQFRTNLNAKEEAFELGRKSVFIHIDGFFKDNPKALKAYREWNKNE